MITQTVFHLASMPFSAHIHTDNELGLHIKPLDYYCQDSGHSYNRNRRVKERLGRD